MLIQNFATLQQTISTWMRATVVASLTLLAVGWCAESCEAQLFRRGRAVRATVRANDDQPLTQQGWIPASNYVPASSYVLDQGSRGLENNRLPIDHFDVNRFDVTRFGSGIPRGYRGFGLPASTPAPVQTFIANPAPISNLGGNGFSFTRGYRSLGIPSGNFNSPYRW